MTRIRIQRPTTHKKGWGTEVWIINNEKYCGKLLKFKKGSTFSDHFHLKKDEAWYVLSGKLELRYYDLSSADKIKKVITPGTVVHIPPAAPHQLRALEESVVLEVSTPHEESDSYRIGKGDSQK